MKHCLDGICRRISGQPGFGAHQQLRGRVETALLDGYLFLESIDVRGLCIVMKGVSEMIREGGDLEWIEALRYDPVFKEQCLSWNLGVEEEMEKYKNISLRQLQFLRKAVEEKIEILLHNGPSLPEDARVPKGAFWDEIAQAS